MNIRLYHPDSILENNTSLLSKEHTHYIVNVMRLKRGSKLNFFNKNGEWKSEIIFLNKDRVEVRFLEKIKEVNNLSKTELAICLVKKNPMDIILQKATELGVTKITPIVSERTEVKELNFERAKKIVIEATEQSNQLIPPEISQVIKLKDFLNNLDSSTKLLFADVNLSIIFACAVLINFVIAGFLGSSIPILLNHFDIDPAAASGVFLTACADAIGFFSFLGLAYFFLV